MMFVLIFFLFAVVVKVVGIALIFWVSSLVGKETGKKQSGGKGMDMHHYAPYIDVMQGDSVRQQMERMTQEQIRLAQEQMQQQMTQEQIRQIQEQVQQQIYQEQDRLFQEQAMRDAQEAMNFAQQQNDMQFMDQMNNFSNPFF